MSTLGRGFISFTLSSSLFADVVFCRRCQRAPLDQLCQVEFVRQHICEVSIHDPETLQGDLISVLTTTIAKKKEIGASATRGKKCHRKRLSNREKYSLGDDPYLLV